jgi:hypothetical protein
MWPIQLAFRLLISCRIFLWKFCTHHLKLFLKKTARWLFVPNTMMDSGILQKEEILCPAEMVNIRNILAVDAPDITVHCLILLFYTRILLKTDSMCVKKDAFFAWTCFCIIRRQWVQSIEMNRAEDGHLGWATRLFEWNANDDGVCGRCVFWRHHSAPSTPPSSLFLCASYDEFSL